jgi:hypothetical protein
MTIDLFQQIIWPCQSKSQFSSSAKYLDLQDKKIVEE